MVVVEQCGTTDGRLYALIERKTKTGEAKVCWADEVKDVKQLL